MAENYVLLETIELTQSAASVTFDNIPQTGYSDLKIVYSGRDTTDSPGSVYIQFNGASYNSTTLKVNGTGSSASSSSHNNAYLGLVPGPSQTANTFSNGEIYIPNYTSSTNKSFSSDVVNENNATAAAQFLWSGLWANTAAITSVTLKTDQAFAQYSTFSLYGLAAVGTTPTVAPKATGGNIVANDGTYWYHAFLSSGNFTPQIDLTCDYLVVAGGGGGGGQSQDGPGGGGAGGLRSTVTTTGGGGSLESPLSLTVNTAYSVTIGAGGNGAGTSSISGSSGNNSTFTTITSIGGGGGSRQSGSTGISGGSGGGGWAGVPQSGGAGTAGQGYAGGASLSTNPPYRGGGGGGAGATGANGSSGGTGGNGVQITALATPTGTGANSGYYAGGGGAGDQVAGGVASGGLGGGGASGNGAGTNAIAGTANTGGGGGAAAASTAANGGSGIVIIRYAM